MDRVAKQEVVDPGFIGAVAYTHKLSLKEAEAVVYKTVYTYLQACHRLEVTDSTLKCRVARAHKKMGVSHQGEASFLVGMAMAVYVGG